MGARLNAKQACSVLYIDMPPLDALRTEQILSRLVGPCTVEWARSAASNVPVVGGVARIREHEIAMIALSAPVREEVLAHTVEVSPMSAEEREALTLHGAAIRLLYLRGSEVPVEQITMLYQVATALVSQGGLGILNERAALAQPTGLLTQYLPIKPGEPLPIQMWVGVVVFDVSHEGHREQYLMRTYGMEQFELPELAVYMGERSHAGAAYHTLMNVCLYLVEGGSRLQIGSGHRAGFNGHTYLFVGLDEPGDALKSRTGLLNLVEV